MDSYSQVVDTRVLRIVDANANRSLEGLRVIEDYLRFVLDDPHLTESCKQLRHNLADRLSVIPASQRFMGQGYRRRCGSGHQRRNKSKSVPSQKAWLLPAFNGSSRHFAASKNTFKNTQRTQYTATGSTALRGVLARKIRGNYVPQSPTSVGRHIFMFSWMAVRMSSN